MEAVIPWRSLRSGFGASTTAAYVTTFWIEFGAWRTSRMRPLKVSPGKASTVKVAVIPSFTLPTSASSTFARTCMRERSLAITNSVGDCKLAATVCPMSTLREMTMPSMGLRILHSETLVSAPSRSAFACATRASAARRAAAVPARFAVAVSTSALATSPLVRSSFRRCSDRSASKNTTFAFSSSARAARRPATALACATSNRRGSISARSCPFRTGELKSTYSLEMVPEICDPTVTVTTAETSPVAATLSESAPLLTGSVLKEASTSRLHPPSAAARAIQRTILIFGNSGGSLICRFDTRERIRGTTFCEESAVLHPPTRNHFTGPQKQAKLSVKIFVPFPRAMVSEVTGWCRRGDEIAPAHKITNANRPPNRPSFAQDDLPASPHRDRGGASLLHPPAARGAGARPPGRGPRGGIPRSDEPRAAPRSRPPGRPRAQPRHLCAPRARRGQGHPDDQPARRDRRGRRQVLDGTRPRVGGNPDAAHARRQLRGSGPRLAPRRLPHGGEAGLRRQRPRGPRRREPRGASLLGVERARSHRPAVPSFGRLRSQAVRRRRGGARGEEALAARHGDERRGAAGDRHAGAARARPPLRGDLRPRPVRRRLHRDPRRSGRHRGERLSQLFGPGRDGRLPRPLHPR